MRIASNSKISNTATVLIEHIRYATTWTRLDRLCYSSKELWFRHSSHASRPPSALQNLFTFYMRMLCALHDCTFLLLLLGCQRQQGSQNEGCQLHPAWIQGAAHQGLHVWLHTRWNMIKTAYCIVVVPIVVVPYNWGASLSPSGQSDILWGMLVL
jgi:hypothetical protein